MTQPRPEARDEQAAALLAAAIAPVDHEKLRRDIAEGRRVGAERRAALCAQLGITPNPNRRRVA